MRIDSQFTTADSATHHFNLPQPGEIWEVCQSPCHPFVLSPEEMPTLYSEAARQFLAGELPPRYVAIVEEAESGLEEKSEETRAIVSVMVLSTETQFISTVDLLVPSIVSGIDCDLLAETWHVLPMLSCNLCRPVGKRLSRKVYDVLLDIGDAYLDLQPTAPSPESIHCLGLKIGTATVRSLEIQAFHQQEREWSDVLSVPLAAYRNHHQKMALATQIADAALEVEREDASITEDFTL